MAETNDDIPYTPFDLKARFEAEKAKRAAMHPVVRFIYDTPRAIRVVFPRMFSSAKFKLRVRVNRAIHGWDEYDWWEYASNTSHRAIPLLTKLRDEGHGIKERSGHPHFVQGLSLDGEGREEWKAILTDMIFFHTVVAADDTEYYDLSDEEKKQYLRGKLAYFRYYEKLWD